MSRQHSGVVSRRNGSDLIAFGLFGFALGLLLVWTVRVEVQMQLGDPSPLSANAAGWYTPEAPVLASADGLVLNFVKPDRAADFDAVTSKVQQAYPGWKVIRASTAAPDGSLVYVFTSEGASRRDNYDLQLALSRAFPSEGFSLYSRYARACAKRQRVVDLASLVEQTR